MALARARNEIIHDGTIPSLNYSEQGSLYNGPLFHRAEFLLRAAVKASLQTLGHPHMWRSSTWRAVKAAWEEAQKQQTPNT